MNYLALFDTILNRVDIINESTVENDLVLLAEKMGISDEVISLALNCDRQLVIYEP